jgi:hypothetical protein
MDCQAQLQEHSIGSVFALQKLQQLVILEARSRILEDRTQDEFSPVLDHVVVKHVVKLIHSINQIHANHHLLQRGGKLQTLQLFHTGCSWYVVHIIFDRGPEHTIKHDLYPPDV